MLQHYLQLAEPWLHQYGYFALFTVLFVEGFGFLLPGQTLLMAAALLASRGEMNITLVLLVSWMATVLGEIVGYFIGLWGGHRVLYKVGFKQSQLDHVEAAFAKYGGTVILFARFLDIVRQLNSIIAGSLQMPRTSFFFYNLIGAALWVGFWGGGVYLLGHHFEEALAVFHRFRPYILILGLVLILTGIGYYLHRRKKGSASNSEP
ncbi:DedA family protein [uncultured Thiothrix sp.]|uniref:DedA family protein n=1 Tax=uncultured Thiothrix sp. TaxID=223185 RepID=UPI0026290716|nr:DedA family protein [uncultured Thiothrix sp.]